MFWECDILAACCTLIIFHHRLLDAISLGIYFLSGKVNYKTGQQNPRMGLLCVKYNVNKWKLILPQQACSPKYKWIRKKKKKKDCLRKICGTTVTYLILTTTDHSDSELQSVKSYLKLSVIQECNTFLIQIGYSD